MADWRVQVCIMRLSRKERAGHAFGGMDPLVDISDEDFNDGDIDFV